MNPMMVKEFHAASRQTMTYAGRALYIGLVGLVVYQYWKNLVDRSVFMNPSEFAHLGRDLFRLFVPLQMGIVSLAAIAAGADRVVTEARRGTLGLLLLTPLTPIDIARAKVAGALAQSVSLLLCGIPVLAVCVYLGGVGPWEVVWSASCTLATAVLSSAFGVRASAIHSTVPKAAAMGLVTTLAWALFPVALIFAGGWPAAFLLPFIHPAYAAVAASMGDPGSRNVFSWGWLPATGVSLLVAWAIVKNAAKHVEKRATTPPALRSSFVPDRPADPAVRGSADPPEVWDHDPLLWKEMAIRTVATWTSDRLALLVLYAGLFTGFCWIFSFGQYQPAFLFLASVHLLVPVAAGASLFAPEKESRRIEMLLSTPVAAWDIVRSKLIAGVIGREVRAALLLAVPTAVAFSYWAGPAGLLVQTGVLTVFFAFAYVLSAFASLRAKTMAGAFVASSGVLCLILLVVPVVARLLADPSAPPGDPGVIPQLLLSINPVWVIEPLERPETVDGARALARFFVFAPLYGLAIMALGTLSVVRCDREIGRA